MLIVNPLKIGELVDELTWRDEHCALAQQWRLAYIDFLKGRIRKAAQIDGSGVLGQAIDIFESDELECFVLDPRVSWRLIDLSGSTAIGGIKNELLRALDERGCVELEGCVTRECTESRGIAIDTDSDYDCPPREPGEVALARLTSERAMRTVNEITSVLSELAQINPSCDCFVRTLTTRIVVREDKNMQSGFASGSFRHHAGMSLIVNPDIVLDDRLRLLDGIVHEAIHSAIYMYEPIVGRLVVDVPPDTLVRSCWSGRMLTVDQFVQACFVWWGLMNFWTKWDAASQCGGGERLLSRAAHGFTARPVSCLSRTVGGGAITESGWDALYSIEAAVTSLASDVRP